MDDFEQLKSEIGNANTVELCSNGPASNSIPLRMDEIVVPSISISVLRYDKYRL